MDSNNDAKFKAYEKTVLSSAKLYVDSYTEDIFGNNESGCYDVGYFDMEKKNLIKDINVLNKTYIDLVKEGKETGIDWGDFFDNIFFSYPVHEYMKDPEFADGK